MKFFVACVVAGVASAEVAAAESQVLAVEAVENPILNIWSETNKQLQAVIEEIDRQQIAFAVDMTEESARTFTLSMEQASQAFQDILMSMRFDTDSDINVIKPVLKQKSLKDHTKKLSTDADDILDNSAISMTVDLTDVLPDPKSLYYYYYYSSFGYSFSYPSYSYSYYYSYSSYYPGFSYGYNSYYYYDWDAYSSYDEDYVYVEPDEDELVEEEEEEDDYEYVEPYWYSGYYGDNKGYTYYSSYSDNKDYTYYSSYSDNKGYTYTSDYSDNKGYTYYSGYSDNKQFDYTKTLVDIVDPQPLELSASMIDLAEVVDAEPHALYYDYYYGSYYYDDYYYYYYGGATTLTSVTMAAIALSAAAIVF